RGPIVLLRSSSYHSGATNEGPQAGPFVVSCRKLQKHAEEQEARLVCLSLDRCRSSRTRMGPRVDHAAYSKTGVDQRPRGVCRRIRREIDVDADNTRYIRTRDDGHAAERHVPIAQVLHRSTRRCSGGRAGGRAGRRAGCIPGCIAGFVTGCIAGGVTGCIAGSPRQLAEEAVDVRPPVGGWLSLVVIGIARWVRRRRAGSTAAVTAAFPERQSRKDE